MRRATSAAAMSAAALMFILGGGASPAIAQQANAVPAISYSGSAAPAAPADAFDYQPAIVTHAIAPSDPQAVPSPGTGDDEARERTPRSLAELVSDYEAADTPDEESDCLARAVYWESKGEPLNGQLAVANVIINRARSGRFASTICGVVRQRSQFSFVRGGYIPAAPQGSRQWRTAVAIALIATRNLAGDAAPQALFFHARSVRPGWRLTRVASVGNHIFYR
jgi:spore germination cell wall hydrolase CwlJ-like protein